MSEQTGPDITTLTVQLLSAFVSNNSVPSESLADLIRTTRAALTNDPAPDASDAQPATYTPAVSVRKSLSSPEHILSMIDGRPYKTLKRHLATHGLTPEDYRQRYNLPKSYPLVAPSYSEARRAVATRLGLGRKPVQAQGKAAETEVSAKPAAPKGERSNMAEASAGVAKVKAAAKPKISDQAKAAAKLKAVVTPKAATPAKASQPKPEAKAADVKVKAKAPRSKAKASTPAAPVSAEPQG